MTRSASTTLAMFTMIFAVACSSSGGGVSSSDASETDTSGETDTDNETGTEPIPECVTDVPMGGWLLYVIDGDFPNDVPNDVDETCVVISASQNVFGLDCGFGDIELAFDFSPTVPVPELGATAQVQIHHEPGWQNWPDLWVSVDVVDGDQYAFQSSSVAQPKVGPYAAPWDVSLTSLECGPFIISDPEFGDDNCGEQSAKQLSFEIDGQTVAAWHGTHVATTVGDRMFEAWITSAREYLAPPETCDFSPSWYSLATWREG